MSSINIKPYLIDFTNGWKNILYSVNNYKQLKKFCLTNNINIIHTHHRYPEYLASLVSRKLGIPTVTTIHSLVSGFKRLSFKSNKVIAVSKAVEKHIVKEFKVAEEKIIQLYNYIEPFPAISENDKDRFREDIGIKKGKKVILFVGRISEVKGCEILIRAFEILSRERDEILLILVGKLYDKKIAECVSKNNNVIIHESTAFVEMYYAISDLIVLPSRKEPLGYVMLEAGICKKPFIGSDVDGIAEFINHKEDGLLFEKENVDHLVENIKYVLDNLDDAQRMANNLYEKVKFCCSKEKYCQNLERIYGNLISTY